MRLQIGKALLPRFLAVLCCLSFFSPTAFARDAKLEAARAEIERRIAASGAAPGGVAVVLRTLDGRKHLEIRPEESFHAASTMKIAVMVELFHQVRAGKLRLDDPLPVRNDFRSIVDGSPFQLDPNDDSDPEPYKKIGSSMTLRQLCEGMITKSSNLATNLLMEKLGIENIRKTVAAYRARGIEIIRLLEDGRAYEKGISNTTTARGLAILLQRIAQGRAVDRDSSEEMLAMMKRQTFNEAIPAGLPPGTAVAHKTGEIPKIHHDAAIIYASCPFVLVLLVRGIEDRDKSSALMAGLTRILYDAVE
jgi:beta-lactamase class A